MQIGNACLKLIHEAAQQLELCRKKAFYIINGFGFTFIFKMFPQKGKYIYIEEMYIVPTWKGTEGDTPTSIPISCTCIVRLHSFCSMY